MKEDEDYQVDPHIFENTFQYSIQRYQYFKENKQDSREEKDHDYSL